ncbi:MAG: sigma-54 dependent transcriptional regulator [Marinobacterium sp.]|nr:sigma-54 dependent transcriptional regulator [Marinobacterium sp.]
MTYSRNQAPSESHPRLLLVEDDPTMAVLVQTFVEDQPFTLDHAENGHQALSQLASQHYAAVLLDLGLPDINGLEILHHIQREQLPTEVIVVTGDCAMSTIIEVMQAGARDFLAKPFARSRLLTTLNNCLEHQRLKAVVDTYQQQLDRHTFGGFIGSSLVMQQVYQIIESAAQSRATVFVTGESGTGKEVCAQSIHQLSDRRDKPFIAINCGAIARELVESEIFGHVKGAFTGALKDRDGAARAAHGGTLFLDEICEMEPALQTRLLRFLQTGTLQKVGSDRAEPVDVRIICATNKDPLQQVQQGLFREDLYYRLHVLPIHLPPLREREQDILEIARQLLLKYSQEEQKAFQHFSSQTEQQLLNYPWPGNVRQLQNVIRNIVVLHDAEQVSPDMLPATLTTAQPATVPAAPHTAHSSISLSATDTKHLHQSNNLHTLPRTQHQQQAQRLPLEQHLPLEQKIRPLAELEREAIEQAIALCDGSVPTAAHYLGISAATIYRKKNSWKAQA